MIWTCNYRKRNITQQKRALFVSQHMIDRLISSMHYLRSHDFLQTSLTEWYRHHLTRDSFIWLIFPFTVFEGIMIKKATTTKCYCNVTQISLFHVEKIWSELFNQVQLSGFDQYCNRLAVCINCAKQA